MGEQKSQQGKPTGKTVNMRFKNDMFYNDLTTPLYKAGVIYPIDTSMEARWVKRGGEIVPPSAMPKPANTKVVAQTEADKKEETKDSSEDKK